MKAYSVGAAGGGGEASPLAYTNFNISTQILNRKLILHIRDSKVCTLPLIASQVGIHMTSTCICPCRRASDTTF